MLEISRPTRIERALREFIIPATPFASTTTLETEKVAVLFKEIEDTSSCATVPLLLSNPPSGSGYYIQECIQPTTGRSELYLPVSVREAIKVK